MIFLSYLKGEIELVENGYEGDTIAEIDLDKDLDNSDKNEGKPKTPGVILEII